MQYYLTIEPKKYKTNMIKNILIILFVKLDFLYIISSPYLLIYLTRLDFGFPDIINPKPTRDIAINKKSDNTDIISPPN